MGLFDFAKDIGKKLFSRDKDAAESIRNHIEADNPGVNDLKVEFNDGEVKISGEAENKAAVEKAVLMAGNVRGVEKVTLSNGASQFEVDSSVEYYTIVSGDTLSALAKRFYGNAMDYPKIFEANREVIKDPNKIFVGQKIRIPKL